MKPMILDLMHAVDTLRMVMSLFARMVPSKEARATLRAFSEGLATNNLALLEALESGSAHPSVDVVGRIARICSGLSDTNAAPYLRTMRWWTERGAKPLIAYRIARIA